MSSYTPGSTRRFSMLLAAAAVAAVVLFPLRAQAQTDPNLQRGFAPDKVYSFGDLDSVNLFNGNLTLALPLGGTYSVNGGLSYGLVLVYNSNVWDFESVTRRVNGIDVSYTQAQPAKESNAGLGWTLSLGKVYPPGTDGSSYWRYLGGDASEHVFYSTLHVGETATSGVYYSRDGSYLRLEESSFEAGTGLPLVAEVELSDGRIQRFTRATSGAAFRLATIRDLYGNQVSVTYPTATRWQISDGHRTHYVDFATRPNGDLAVSKVDLAAFSGARQVYDFAYSDVTISRSCLDDDPESLGGTPSTAAVSLLATVTAAFDGSKYTFNTYNTTCQDGAVTIDNLPGTLAKLTLPTLGQMEWTYQDYTFPVRGTGCGPGGPGISISKVAGVKTKRVLNASGVCETWEDTDCQWDYTPATLSSSRRKTTVDLPTAGHSERHYFHQGVSLSTSTWDGWQYGLPFDPSSGDGGGRYLSTEVYDGATKLRSVYVRYEHDRLPSSTCYADQWYQTNRREASRRTVYEDDKPGGVATYAEVTQSSFDGLGHYRQAVTAGNFGAGDARTTFADFNPERGTYVLDPATNSTSGSTFSVWPTARNWVLGTAQSTSVTEGAQTAKSDFCFESRNTDSMKPFLLRQRVMKGTAAGANDLVTSYARDATGNVTEERSYGGDKVTVGTTADLCALTLTGDQYFVRHTYAYGSRATSKWQTSGGAALAGGTTLDQTVDANSGLPASVRDVAGVQTNLTWDALGRLTWEKPTTGNGAWVEYKWTKATAANATAKVEVFQRPNGSTTSSLAQKRIYFDPFGRFWRDQVLGADGTWSTVDTQWNSMGWKRSVTEREPVWPTHWTIFKDFDPFGRPGTVKPPDGDAHKITLSYAGVRVTNRTVKVKTGASETDSTTTETYDRQGRLWKVAEPSGSGGASVTTTYGYDVGGRLSSVSTSGQSRSFSYDNRGFLAWEKHPEKGPSGNGYVRYLSYDALGNPGRKLDAVATSSATTGAASDLTFTYDRASRLTQVSATGGSVLKAFTFGTANVGSSKQLGKLVTADRYNYILIGTTPFTVQVRETYAYAGVGGATSSRNTQVYVNGGAQEAFTQAWSWNDLGDRSTLTYPRCTHSGCNGAALSSRSVSFGYGNGFLTSVPSYTSSISYHPSGMVSQVAHANGVTWSQAADPYGMARPASFSTSGASINWTSGAYAYDGSGNVTAIGSSTFTYDAVSRLTSSSVQIGTTAGSGAFKAQTVTYDSFGNVTSLATDGPPVTLTTSTSTNRLNASSYDSMGSMTAWNANTYEHDPFGMPWRVTQSGVQYHYLYTADDERIWTFQSGAPSRWTVRDLDGQVLREFSNNAGTWSVEKDYVYRDGVLLAAVGAGETRHVHPDHLGTPRLITGAAGVYRAYHAYHPFGSEATSFNQDTERLKFTGHERDLGITTSTADDLDYMHARFYNMQIARFMVTDPSAASVAMRMPQTWNRYAYALASPLKFVDPSGAIVEFADKEAQKAYEAYKSQLGASSQDYANLVQLEKSDITYVINIENLSGSNEGSTTFDGQKVFLNVDGSGGGVEHSLQSRLAHELQHGVQVDNGEIGFHKDGDRWVAQFVDIGDEVSAWNASVRQATKRDLALGPVADYNRAKNKTRHLYQRGYGWLRGTEKGFSVPRVPDVKPGSVLHTSNTYWRIPR